ncbi:hypothetical protein ASPZODRAFT_127452 [Penicilliopsis zonata CBS 506.65]|uniref:Uncharacterized protein n=1 Tax=Penicilliopsis zonata CBS 506.65 TaxID=1073090 RepID=A0A1L9SW05_9EURO|nr:hypothetical protein ASPZODRAFT_127452 [Penicilliopsis zonata CBS 506.65]OJJ51380.1 hypothetical protein ASPZODRAFT_127452 [Penicilliopsis zonata CBS 506.65]
MSVTRFYAALQARQMYEVQMNQVHFILFASNIRAIGTRNLNGCTAVAIVSPFAAILAHIPPLPYPTTDPYVGLDNVQAKMGEVAFLYQQNRRFFPSDQSSLVVGAIFGGAVALSDHLTCIRGLVEQNGLTAELALYEVNGGGHLDAAKGTVFIDARHGSPSVYIEDQQVQM